MSTVTGSTGVPLAQKTTDRGSEQSSEANKPEADGPPAKRGRGRPRKNPLSDAPAAGGAVKRGRGRPKKTDSDAPTPGSAVKRGRGRPRKSSPPPVPEGASDTPKRGRGRPKGSASPKKKVSNGAESQNEVSECCIMSRGN